MIDTNIVLDLFVFRDERARPVMDALRHGRLRWLATAAMRDELARVLGYPQLAPRLRFHGLEAAQVLREFDRHALPAQAPAKAAITCKDPDDQMFIDLAVAHGARLLSKDGAVLAMRKRLARLGVVAGTELAPAG